MPSVARLAALGIVLATMDAATPATLRPAASDSARLVRGGEVLVPQPNGSYRRYAFRTLPDSTVRIEVEGDAVDLPVTTLLNIARAYDAAVPLAPPTTRAGYDVDDGQITVYFSRRVPVAVVLGVLAALAVLAVAFAVWAVVRIRRDARRKAELAAFRETLATSREAERLRLARELHDGPLQEFHAVRLGLTSAEAAPDLEADLLGAIREVRHVVEDLRPPALDAYGLRASLESLAVRFGRRHPEIHAEVEVGEGPVALPEKVQLAVYRVCQEALANAGWHAGASAVRVEYRERGGRFSLVVEDDGAGFDASAAPTPGHFGLAGIRERAEAIGAVVEVSSQPGAGTRIVLVGPALFEAVAERKTVAA